MPWICPVCGTTNESTELYCFLCDYERSTESIEAEKKEERRKKTVKQINQFCNNIRIFFIIFSFLSLTVLVFFVVISLITNNFISNLWTNIKTVFYVKFSSMQIEKYNIIIESLKTPIIDNLSSLMKNIPINTIIENITKLIESVPFVSLTTNLKQIFEIIFVGIKNFFVDFKDVIINSIFIHFKVFFEHIGISLFNSHWEELILIISEVMNPIGDKFKMFFINIKIIIENIGIKFKEFFTNIVELIKNSKDVLSKI